MKRVDLRLPDDLYEQLKAAAERDRRSVNAQILRFVEEGVERAKQDVPGR